MKDPEFIELLNLYLDHEISAQDAARLEAEVQSNPKRRHLYHEYCCMQKACVVLAQQAAPAEAEQRNVVAFEPRRSWGLGSYGVGLFAAAACIALVLVARNRNEPALNQAPSLASQPAADSQAGKKEMISPRSIAQTVSVVPRSSNELKPVFTAASFALGGNRSESRTTEILPATDARFEWMNRIQVSSLTRVPAEDLIFDAKSAPTTESRIFVSQRPLQSQVERTAFQFQR